jgi:transcriptional regulator with XRE-family HTH domain
LRKNLEMENLKVLREKIGLSQEEMARFLGISRAQWAMAETGKRRIPPGANQKLEFLQNQITAAMIRPLPLEVVDAQKKRAKENRQLLIEHAVVCKNKAKNLRKDLVKLSKKQELLEIAARLPASEKENTADMDTHELIIEVKRRESIEALIDKNGSEEMFLSLQIEMLEEEATRAIKKAEELNN